ncbi:MAG TPA: hypothetical protein VN944_07435, partial [Nitrospiria bacterium]|nr:hypothetical protein [Nitrospiria bacterium]
SAVRTAPKNSIPVSDENAAERLKELRRLAEKSDALSKKESDLLDLKDKVYNIKRSLGELETANADLSRIEEKEASFAGFQSIPRDAQQILDEYENNQAEKMVEQGELTEDIALIEQQLQMDQRNLLQNKFLWGGGILTALSLILGLFLELEGPERYVQGLVLVTGVGLVGYALYQDLMRGSQKKAWKNKLENKNKNLEILTARFKRENAKYFELLEKTGTENRESFETRFTEFKNLMGEKYEVTGRIEKILSGRSIEDLEREMIENQTKLQAQEEEIAIIKPGIPDSYTVQNEIRAIEERLNPGMSISGGSSFEDLTGGPAVANGPGLEMYGGSSPGLGSFFEKDWDLLTASAGLTAEQVAQFLQKRLSALCGNRLKMTVMPGGKIESDPGFETLSSGILDFLFIGMFLIRSQLLRKIPFPLVLDDPMVTLDSELQGILLNFAKDVSRGRTILWFSHTGYPVENANLIKI